MLRSLILPADSFCTVQRNADRLYVADVFGDWWEEITFLSGNELLIYQTLDPNRHLDRRGLERGHYRRSEMTWKLVHLGLHQTPRTHSNTRG